MNDLQRFATNVMEVFHTSPNPRRDLADALFVRQARATWDNVDDIIDLVEQKAFVAYKMRDFQLNYLALVEQLHRQTHYHLRAGRFIMEWGTSNERWMDEAYEVASLQLPGWDVRRIPLLRHMVPIDILYASAKWEYDWSEDDELYSYDWDRQTTFLAEWEKVRGYSNKEWMAINNHFEKVGDWLYRLKKRRRDNPHIRYHIFGEGDPPMKARTVKTCR